MTAGGHSSYILIFVIQHYVIAILGLYGNALRLSSLSQMHEMLVRSGNVNIIPIVGFCFIPV